MTETIELKSKSTDRPIAIVAMKVLALWKHRKYTAKLLRAIFALTYGCMFVMTILYVKYLMGM